MAQRIHYEIEDRNVVMAQNSANGKTVTNDVTIGIVNGRLADCYCDVEDTTEPEKK